VAARGGRVAALRAFARVTDARRDSDGVACRLWAAPGTRTGGAVRAGGCLRAAAVLNTRLRARFGAEGRDNQHLALLRARQRAPARASCALRAVAGGRISALMSGR
jgi:hypothetical protein